MLPNRALYPMNDNTVGPVTLTSGYGSNTFPYSVAHVLDSSTRPNTLPDTRECEPNKTYNSLNHTKYTGSSLAVTQKAHNSMPKYSCFNVSYTESQMMKVSPSPITFK